jgi:hypothetical protein
MAPGELADVSAGQSVDLDGAIYQLATLLTLGSSLESPGRLGRLSTLARKVVKRILGHHSRHELKVHSAVLDALRRLDRNHRDLQETIRRQERARPPDRKTARPVEAPTCLFRRRGLRGRGLRHQPIEHTDAR